MLKSIQAKAKNGTFDMIRSESLDDYDLGGVDCPVCQNKGYVMYRKDGYDYTKECECMNKRRFMRRIRKSGMSDMLRRYTFDSYETPDTSRQKVKAAAERFCESDTGWFYIAGQSGSGKTHICTAICSRLIEKGRDVHYMEWRDEIRQFKAIMNTEELDKKIERLKKVKVLYIDDFLKGGCSDADIRLAFEIINSRYNDTKLRTIFSTEATLEAVLSIDEALGSRIVERSKGFKVAAPRSNWRLR